MAEHRTLTARATVGPVRQGAGLVREGAAGSTQGRHKDKVAASSSAPHLEFHSDESSARNFRLSCWLA